MTCMDSGPAAPAVASATAAIMARREFGSLTALALPIIVTQLSQMGMGVADTVMAGRSYLQQAIPTTFGHKIAGLLALRPSHLVLDEPTSHLDPAGTRMVGEAITRLARGGASILIAEQNTDLLAGICTRVLALDHGRIRLDGTPEVVLADPVLESLGVDLATPSRLRRMAAAAGVDPARLAGVA